MLGKTYDSQVCSIARSLEVVGERWSLLIVREAVFGGATRYSDFQRNLGIATNILKARLDRFVESGIMRRHRYSEQPELYEYLLTDKGRALAPALALRVGRPVGDRRRAAHRLHPLDVRRRGHPADDVPPLRSRGRPGRDQGRDRARDAPGTPPAGGLSPNPAGAGTP
jgi:DNA-binding HxlR family transcriptional regulator